MSLALLVDLKINIFEAVSLSYQGKLFFYTIADSEAICYLYCW